jgi:hypothetical protein
MNHANETAHRTAASCRTHSAGGLFSSLLLYLLIIGILAGVNAVQSPGVWWVVWPALGLGLLLLVKVWRVVVTPYFTGESRRRRS